MSQILKLEDFDPTKIAFHQTIRDGQEVNGCSYGTEALTPWFQFSGTVQFDYQPGNKVVFHVDEATLTKFKTLDAHFKTTAPTSDERYNPIVYQHEHHPSDVRIHLSKYVHDHSNGQDDPPEQTMPSVVRGARVMCIARVLRWYESPEYGVGYSIKIGRIRTISLDPEMRAPEFLE